MRQPRGVREFSPVLLHSLWDLAARRRRCKRVTRTGVHRGGCGVPAAGLAHRGSAGLVLEEKGRVLWLHWGSRSPFTRLYTGTLEGSPDPQK